jgi:hypothetical protein
LIACYVITFLEDKHTPPTTAATSTS